MYKLLCTAWLSLAGCTFVSAQLPAGCIAEYSLNGIAADISGNSYDGILTSIANTTNRFGTANSAIAFTAGSSTGSLPLALVTAISGDFTIGFWIRTTMTANSSTQWYGGNALVDAEVCGGTSDYGLALIDGGKVAFGIGNPDITIKSIADYNDGNWHFVTATRKQSTGTINLYMEGMEVATSGSTTTASLTAPPAIMFASNPCVPAGVYTGGLDDMIVYNRVLSSPEVLGVYNYMNAITLPLQWLSFTGKMDENNARLQWEVGSVVDNDRFEIEHSQDGRHFLIRGTLKGNDGIPTFSGSSFAFTDLQPVVGLHFYRIRQVDGDGKYSFSSIIKLKAGKGIAAFSLQSNPVGHELVLLNRGNIKILRLAVCEISGRILVDKQVRSTEAVTRIATAQWQPGYYLLKINSESGQVSLPWIKR